MLNKITLSIIISFFIIFHNFSSLNAEMNIFKNIEVKSDFPNGINFIVETEDNINIKSIAVRYTLGQQKTSIYEYLDKNVNSDNIWNLYLRTNTREKYIPPGTIVNYNFEITDLSNKTYRTKQEVFIYSDARFKWENISNNMINVSYHGPVQSRAQLVLDTIVETIDRMSPLLGIDISEPIRVTMYNNIPEMVVALPPSSDTVRTQLVTQGQAYPDLGVLLILGNSASVVGTSSHEITHILNHRAADSVYRSLPSWLDEGLAEYGNSSPSLTYDKALEYAINNDLIIPITLQNNMPGDADEIIIFYGQAMSIVDFMINNYGEENLRNLLINLKEGFNIDKALENVYGFNRIELENNWRNSLGIPEYKPSKKLNSLPTAIPIPTIKPYTLDNQSSKTNNDKNIKKSLSSSNELTNSKGDNLITEKQLNKDTNGCSFNNVKSNKEFSIILLALSPIIFLLKRRKGIKK